ncbi:protein rolling stone [Eurytemora carolleeae]|uniref:protein rolling stone n=1 Tax=Eurytemora carolleeae TaxID=1294199 RepID=UPI000C793CCB|nr:protein rolling stone [Eurytemora carolleeae]|eukprot:XP_023346985.1 protein rolling stone-like [Eurytemora affinis]
MKYNFRINMPLDCRGFWSWDKFKLTHEDSDRFHRSQWNKAGEITTWYLVYRICIALAMVIGVAAHIGSTTDTLGSKWFIYMTNQGIGLLTIHYVIYAGIVSGRYFSSTSKEIFPRLYSFSWGMQTTFTTIALFITLIYWAFLHRYVVEFNLLPGTWMKVLNVFLHAINSVSALIDLFLTARPIRFQHVYLPLLFGIYYAIFSVIYWAAGGVGICRSETDCDPYIYPILDWDGNPGGAVLFVFLGFIGTFIIQGFVYGLYRLRTVIHKKATGTELITD